MAIGGLPWQQEFENKEGLQRYIEQLVAIVGSALEDGEELNIVGSTVAPVIVAEIPSPLNEVRVIEDDVIEEEPEMPFEFTCSPFGSKVSPEELEVYLRNLNERYADAGITFHRQP